MSGEHMLITCLSHQTVSCLRVEAGCICSLHPQRSASPMPGLAESFPPTLWLLGWMCLQAPWSSHKTAEVGEEDDWRGCGGAVLVGT